MNTIFPTHSCFDDTVANMIPIVREDARLISDGRLLIVHGIILWDGKPLAHGWLELEGKWVIDCGILNGQKITYHASLDEFYREIAPLKTTKYTPADAAGMETRTGNCGPWEPEYRAACGREEDK